MPLPMLGVDTYTVTRRTGAVDWSSGRAQASGATETLTCRGSVQPATDHRVLEALPEGARLKDARWIYTSFAFQIADDDDQSVSDEISIDGQAFVAHEAPRLGGHLSHDRVLLVRKDVL